MTQRLFIYLLTFIINFNFMFIQSMQVNSTKSTNLEICHVLWPFIEIIFKGRDKYEDFCYNEELEIIIQQCISKLIEYANCNLVKLVIKSINTVNPKSFEIPEHLAYSNFYYV